MQAHLAGETQGPNPWRPAAALMRPARALAGAADEVKFDQPEKARWVRVLVTKPATADGYLMTELEVWGKGGVVARPQAAPAAVNGRLRLSAGNWRIQRDSLVAAAPMVVARTGFDDRAWLPATVPGTVVSSWFADGAIPDPAYDNTMTMLSGSFFYGDFWYRNEFTAPPAAVETVLRNSGAEPVSGTLRGRFGAVPFELPVTVQAGAVKTVRVDPSTTPALRLKNPKLWWPAGYGEQNLYDVELSFVAGGWVSDMKAFRAGVRQHTYKTEPVTGATSPMEQGDTLKIWINGRRFIARGGNWGFPEELLRYRAREYDWAVRYHRYMNFWMTGAQGLSTWLEMLEKDYGGADTLEDFVALSQFIGYDGYRAMFEAQGRNRMGLLLWMSHPCWPSFVWETYDYYFDQSGGYYGAKKGSEPLHIQWNPMTDHVEVVNYSAGQVAGLTASREFLNLDGSKQWEKSAALDSEEDGIATPIHIDYPAGLSATHFLRLTLRRGAAVVSENFFLRGTEEMGSKQELPRFLGRWACAAGLQPDGVADAAEGGGGGKDAGGAELRRMGADDRSLQPVEDAGADGAREAGAGAEWRPHSAGDQQR